MAGRQVDSSLGPASLCLGDDDVVVVVVVVVGAVVIK